MTRDLAVVYAALPPAARAHVRNRLRLPMCLPLDFVVVLRRRHYSALDVVVALANSPAFWASAAIGCVAGRPVTHCAARPPRPHALLRTPLLVGPGARRVLSCERNPRLPTTPSFARYALLRPGMTVESFIKRGGRARDVREWAAEGSIVLSAVGGGP